MLPGWAEVPPDSPDRLDFSLRVETAGQDSFVLLENDRAVYGPSGPSDTVEALQGLLHLRVAEYARDAVYIHAAAVCVNGTTAIFPGSSGCGKSTLCAALVEAGASLYSDEYAIVGTDGRLRVFPRPLKSRNPLQKVLVPGEQPPRAVDLVALLTYSVDHMPFLQRLSPGQGCLRLLEHTVGAQRSPGLALSVISGVCASAPVYEGYRREVEEWVDHAADMVTFCESISNRRMV